LEFDDLKEDAAFLQEMNKRIVEQELDRHLAVALNKLDIRKIRLSNSQLVRLRLNVRKQGGAGEPHFAVFRRYLDGTEKRKSADDQFRKSRIRHDPLRQWLLNLVEKPAKTWDVIGLQNYGWVLKEGQWQRRLLGEAVYQLDEGLAINYTVRLIDGLCERVQKERK
jgi:hypothetical protein